ncbi:DMT family transporter [Mycetocola reblochoni]|uniref:Quaternary ammonium compound-resistance protein SugE n=2 Tax=Mycetocola reblochoni TaxID=331618 RepID=A0A1R4JCS2_9MICO|nr:SMR family transporter [Mycetocola reblochoni]RLP69960.1 QacE family quaternary ammonium compound efflux SMR transporter [Mycetocola reblochoni]SJN29832.1 Quaternary ammonium compound-resistance protein SugE [Mycetocola reblochoni REB411]
MLVHWSVLVASGLLEAVWALALARAKGFTRLGPTIVFLVALVVSMAGLAFAMTGLPTGTAYAVWVGIGAVVTVGVSMLRREEDVSVARVLLLVLLVGCVVGLKAVS